MTSALNSFPTGNKNQNCNQSSACNTPIEPGGRSESLFFSYSNHAFKLQKETACGEAFNGSGNAIDMSNDKKVKKYGRVEMREERVNTLYEGGVDGIETNGKKTITSANAVFNNGNNDRSSGQGHIDNNISNFSRTHKSFEDSCIKSGNTTNVRNSKRNIENKDNGRKFTENYSKDPHSLVERIFGTSTNKNNGKNKIDDGNDGKYDCINNNFSYSGSNKSSSSNINNKSNKYTCSETNGKNYKKISSNYNRSNNKNNKDNSGNNEKKKIEFLRRHKNLRTLEDNHASNLSQLSVLCTLSSTSFFSTSISSTSSSPSLSFNSSFEAPFSPSSSNSTSSSSTFSSSPSPQSPKMFSFFTFSASSLSAYSSSSVSSFEITENTATKLK